MAEIVVKENGEVVEGNTAVIDFEGIVDGKKLDGGTGVKEPFLKPSILISFFFLLKALSRAFSQSFPLIQKNSKR